MTATEFVPRLLDILEGNREEIEKALKNSREASSRLSSLLEVNKLNSELEGWEDGEQMAHQMQYLLDLFRVYTETGGLSEDKKKSRMERFAESYQVHPDNVKTVLAYFGLEI